jgi:hypothetical protein
MPYRELITFIERADAPLWHGIAISLAILAGAEARSFLTNTYFYVTSRVAFQIQATLASAVYRKVRLRTYA